MRRTTFNSGWDLMEAAHLGSVAMGSDEDFKDRDTELSYSRRSCRRLHLGRQSLSGLIQADGASDVFVQSEMFRFTYVAKNSHIPCQRPWSQRGHGTSTLA